ncbi:reverse transcriptase domain-containing protein [Paraburkholderia sp. 40]|uniref:reverse transcriptase domain-containing protein n=1 Tax=Paraburkholderia sp. 40 TaxID=2991059 RepID=UPI003D1B7ADB
MNLFMHYAFDAWMQRHFPKCPFARYADDAVVHCRSQEQAQEVMHAIASRLTECGLTMHPEKGQRSCIARTEVAPKPSECDLHISGLSVSCAKGVDQARAGLDQLCTWRQF